jgi:ferredoxin-NADP reductase
MWKWYDSKIIQIEAIAPTTRRFWLQIEGAIPFEFKAGQFVTMDLPISEKRLKRWRSYSIASMPTLPASDILEFCIVRSDTGAGTKYLFEEATIGTNIRFKAPDGNFVLTEERIAEKNLVFICTGTGVAPFRSMIHDILNRQLPYKKLHLIFGTRTEEGILYRNEFEDLQSKYPNFKYDVVLSRPKPSWEGRRGYVHQVYMEDYPNPSAEMDFWICGWSKMIDEAVEHLLLDLKCVKSQIHYELYG